MCKKEDTIRLLGVLNEIILRKYLAHRKCSLMELLLLLLFSLFGTGGISISLSFFYLISGNEFRGFSHRRKRRPMFLSLGLAKFVALAMNITVKRSYGLPPLCELI